MLREKQNTKKVTPLSYNYHFISVGTGLGRGGGVVGRNEKKVIKKAKLYISQCFRNKFHSFRFMMF